MQNYQISCGQCGKSHMISTTRAGDSITCSCGCEVDVPPLSELRKSAGLAAYEKPVSERILQSVFDGELPTRRECACCGEPRAEQQYLVAVCERSYQQSEGGGAVAGVIGGIPFYVPVAGSPSGEHVGRNVIVPLVFNICSSCWLRCRGLTRWPKLLRASAIILVLLAAASLGVWLIFPDAIATRTAFLAAGACFLSAFLTQTAAIWSSTPSLSKLKKGLCAEPVYRELFKQYPNAELCELEASEDE